MDSVEKSSCLCFSCKKEIATQDIDVVVGLKPVKEEGPAYLDTIGQAWVDHLEANGRDGPWLKDLIVTMNKYWWPRLTHKPVNNLTYQDMLNFISVYKDRSQSTRNRYFCYLKAMLRFGIKHKMTTNNPLEGWSKSKEPYRELRLTVEDLGKILVHAKPHLKWALLLVFYTGIRPGPKELFSLTWDDVDFEKGVINVFRGKGNKARAVTICDALRPLLLGKKAQAQPNYLIEYQGERIRKIRRSLPTGWNHLPSLYV